MDDSQPTIVIDAGHGGHDNGASRNGLHEKDLTLDTALRLEKLLMKKGFSVVLTRRTDSFVELPGRVEIANRIRRALFVSIHFNALPRDSRTSGVEVYTFAPRFQRSTNAWSAGEKDDTEDYASPGNRHDHWNVVLAHSVEGPTPADRIARFRALRTALARRPLAIQGMQSAASSAALLAIGRSFDAWVK